MSIRLVSPATFSLFLLAIVACGTDSSPKTGGEAPASSNGEPRRPLNIEDAVAVGFTKQRQTLYSQIAAQDGWQGTYEGILVQIYVFPEIVPGYVPTSFFTDAVKKEATWKAHRIVRNVGILCGTEGVCATLEKELRMAGGGSARPAASVAQKPAREDSEVGETSTPEREIARAEPREEPQTPSSSETTNGEDPARPAVEPPSPAEGESSVGPAVVEPEAERNPAPAPPTGRALPYSVAIASFTSLEDALAKQRELGGEGLTLFVAPVVVKGRPYYRLLAGALTDRDAARALQASLVQRRIKREATAWDIRPANLAFHMGTYASASEAGSAVRGLVDRGIPAYTLGGPNGVYVYAGGYEDEGDADLLSERIRKAGVEAELVERRGVRN